MDFLCEQVKDPWLESELNEEKLEHVLEELSKKKEYNFTFEAWREGRMHDC